MAQTIKLKRSATSGATPTTSQLELGEVAINTYDGKMYIKKDVGGTESIVEIGGLSSVALGGLSDVTISSAAADQLLQYNGSEWVNVSIAEASAIMKEYQFTATSGQSTFSGSDDNSETLSYTAGAIQVFLNGIFLDSAVDYTATNGTSIVLSETVDANDYLQVVAFKKKIGDGNVSVDTFTGDDSTTAFTLSVDPGDENNTRVFIDGVYQSKDNYSVSGTTLTFSTAPPTSTAIEVEIGNRVVTLDTLSDLDLPDDVKLRLGTSQDLQIYHDGSNSYIDEAGTGELRLRSNEVELRDMSNNVLAKFSSGGANNLYYGGSSKLATTNDGISVTGDVEADEFIGDVRGAVLFKAQAGETLAKGDVVYISGISGNTTIVSKADADDASKMPAFGLAAAAASSGNPVDIYTNGILSGIDTSSYSEGDELFVSTTAGALTATAPTGESAALQKIGKVTRSASSGSIFIVGAGRTNAVPNLNEGKLFVGNSSNQAVADDTVHVDIANSVVGINKTSPSSAAALHVDGHIYVDTGDAIYADFFRPYSTTLATYGSSTNTDHYFLGSVGIGESSPEANLHVKNGSAGTFTASNSQLLIENNTTVRLSMVSPATNACSIEFGDVNDQNVGVITYDHTSNYMKFGVNASEAMRIDSSGNLLVGTTDSTLFNNTTGTGVSLNNSGYIEAASTGAPLYLNRQGSDGTIASFRKDGSTVGSIGTKNGFPYFGLGSTNISVASNAVLPKGAAGVTNDAAINLGGSSQRFQDLYLSGTANVTAIEITGVGNRGVQITTANVDVGYINFGDPQDTNAGLIAYDHDVDELYIRTAGSERMRIDSSGNVGIGTVSPSIQVDVENTVANSGGKLRLGTSDSSTSGVMGRLIFGNGNDIAQSIIEGISDGATDASALVFKTEATGSSEAERMRIDSSGNVGIDPSSGYTLTDKLTVRGSQSQLRIQDSSVDAKGVSLLYSNSNNYGQLICDHRGNNQLNFYYSALNHYFGRNTSSSYIYMTLTDTGELGIGTTSPSAPLDVQGSTGLFMTRTSSGLASYIENDGGYAAQYLYQIGGSAKIALHANGSSYFNGGNVGIGTTSPNFSLDISGANNSQLRLLGTDTNPTTIVMDYNSGGATGRIRIQNDDGDMKFTTNNGNVRQTILENGNVGIGVTDPDVILEVSGSARFAQENHAWTFDDTINNRLGFVKQSGSYSMLASAANTPIIFATSNNSNLQSSVSGQTLYERMRVNYNGNVGIGTTSPEEKLHVVGKGTFENAGNVNRGNLILGPHGSGASKWATLAGTHYNEATGSGNGSANAGIMIIGSHAQSGSNQVYIGHGPYELNPATHIRLGTHSSDTHNLGGTTHMIIGPSGDVGIGTDSPLGVLSIGDHTNTSGTTSDVYISGDQVNANDYYARLMFRNSNQSGGSTASIRAERLSNNNGTGLTFYTNGTFSAGDGTERMRLEYDGNLLVGKTGTSFSTAGSRLTPDGGGQFIVDGAAGVEINRLTSDGDIVAFYKDTTKVGSIGASGGLLVIGDSDCGIAFEDGTTNHIYPWNVSGGAANNDAISLGANGAAFKDLYMSGTVFAGDADFSGEVTAEDVVLNSLSGTTVNASTAVDVFVYDTRNDSDGGEWRKRVKHTSWYNETLNTSARGARKDFPQVALIVVFSSGVDIYDGDDPDTPIWMQFSHSGYGNMLGEHTNSTVSMLNGRLVLGCNPYDMYVVDFIQDKGWSYSNGSSISGTYFGNISERNIGNARDDSLSWTFGNVNSIVNRYIYHVDMAVRPNAPVDPVSGLPIPIIAAATAGGVSVILENGNIVDVVSGTLQHETPRYVKFMEDELFYLVGNNYDQGWKSGHKIKIPQRDFALSYYNKNDMEAKYTTIEWSTRNTDETDLVIPIYMNNPRTAAFMDKGRSKDELIFAGKGSGMHGGVVRLKEELTNRQQGMLASIGVDHNSGYQVGRNSKLASLCETTTGNLVASDVLSGKGAFSSASDWSAPSGWSVSGGVATGTAVTNYLTPATNGILTTEKMYKITITQSAYTSGALYVYAGQGAPGGYLHYDNLPSAVGTYTLLLRAYNTNFGIYGANYTGTIDNVTIVECETDYSQLGYGIAPHGTIQRAVVATGAELVGYYGWGTNNYFEQPYTNLNIGSGDFCMMWWQKKDALTGSTAAVPIEFSNPDSDVNGNPSALVYEYLNKVRFYTRGTSGSWHFIEESKDLLAATWQCYAVVRRNGKKEIWRNGELVGESNHNDVDTRTVTSTSTIIRVGKRSDGAGSPFDGMLALVRVTGTAPTPEQIAYAYAEERPLFAVNAKATIGGSSNAVTGLSYDDGTDLLHVGTSGGRSVFQGLNRTEFLTDAIGVAINARNGSVLEE